MVLEGKTLAAKIREGVKQDVAVLRQQGVQPHLVVLLVGEDPASKVYVGQKEKACQEVGIRSTRVDLPASTTRSELMGRVKELNEDGSVHGILVQLPLPRGLDPFEVQEAVSPDKDVDGLHPENIGKLAAGRPGFVPCTPAGILALLDYYQVELVGRHAVVLGRSLIVGKPMAALLLGRHCTVTQCHTRTRDRGEMTRQADLIVAAVGVPRTLKGEEVKEGAVVIDVGTSRVDGKLVGDVDFESVSARAWGVTPVPGGVGPLTVAMLMRNVLGAARTPAGSRGLSAGRADR